MRQCDDERDTETETETERQRHRDRDTETQTETERQRQRDADVDLKDVSADVCLDIIVERVEDRIRSYSELSSWRYRHCAVQLD